MPTADDLARIPLFAGLDAGARTELASRFDEEDFAEGKTVVAEGSSGYAFYVIADGTAEVQSGVTVVRRLGPGDHFGEIAILGEGRRTATVKATSPLTLWVLFGTTFRVLQTSRPDVADALTRAMEDRLAAG